MSVDPYKPPRVVHRHLAFADGGPLCLNTTPGLAACIAVGSLLGVEVLTVVLLYQPFVSRADVMTVFGPMQVVTAILPFASVVTFLVWQHSAVGNLRRLGRRGMTWSPAGSVGYWFLPFFNLVHGHKVATELWKASDPDGAELEPEEWRGNPTTPLITWWWLAWLVSRLGKVLGASVPVMLFLVAS